MNWVARVLVWCFGGLLISDALFEVGSVESWLLYFGLLLFFKGEEFWAIMTHTDQQEDK